MLESTAESVNPDTSVLTQPETPITLHPAPVERQDRIQSVDVLRGFSLLGILLLNINSFGLPFAAYMNPAVWGGDTGADFVTWLTAMTLWDGKMRCLFSMLFGTSALLLLDRAERRGAGIEAADIYYRRTLWLILFGMLHAYLIWYGDILYSYGVVGLLLFPLRKLSAKALIIAGITIVIVHSLMNIGAGFGIAEMRQKADEVTKLADTGAKLTAKQRKTLSEWENMQSMFGPARAEVVEEVAKHRGSWLTNFQYRAGIASMFQFQMFFQYLFLDVLGMLVLGMGLAKAGVFAAARSYGFYLTLAILGFAIGVPLNYWAAQQWAATKFDIPAYFTYMASTADPGRFLVAAGYLGVIMMICKAGALPWLTGPLSAVGRTALSNYLLTSILMTFLFDGWGLGWFGQLSRAQLLWVVLGMWILNLIASPLWLRKYRFGPAEWLWRSLTYWKRQPMNLA